MGNASSTFTAKQQFPFAIRPATRSDKTAVLACLAAAFAPFREQYTREAYLDTVLTPDSMDRRISEMCIYVAISSNQLVGTIACKSDGADGLLRGMAVLPEWQGRGVALALLKSAEAELRGSQCQRVKLHTTAPLTRAARFYEKNGYAATGRVSDFFGMRLYEFVKTL